MKYSIPEPCHEDWNKMTPKAKGRLCAACKKCVVDFSKLSDTVAKRELESYNSETVCGRFGIAQLERINTLSQQKNGLNILKRTAAMAATIALLQTTSYAQKPGSSNPIETVDSKSQILQGIIAKSSSPKITKDTNPPTTVIITGRVVDGGNHPISDASVYVKGGDSKVQTDENGYYRIVLISNKRKDVELVFESSWITTQIRTVILDQSKIKLEDQILYEDIMGELSIEPTSFFEKAIDRVKQLL